MTFLERAYLAISRRLDRGQAAHDAALVKAKETLAAGTDEVLREVEAASKLMDWIRRREGRR